MFDTIAGLPLHPLVVHATEVLVPSAALVIALAALWPTFRRWARFLPLGLALVSLVLVPISIQSGEALQERVKESSLIETHSELADRAQWRDGRLVPERRLHEVVVAGPPTRDVRRCAWRIGDGRGCRRCNVGWAAP